MVTVQDMPHRGLVSLLPRQRKAGRWEDGGPTDLEEVPSLPPAVPPPLASSSTARPPMAWSPRRVAPAGAVELPRRRQSCSSAEPRRPNLPKALICNQRRRSYGGYAEFWPPGDPRSVKMSAVMEQLFRKHGDQQCVEERRRSENLERLKREQEDIDRERWS